MRSREQIDAARAKANAVRDGRAILRARVRPLAALDGRYELAAILEESHDCLSTLPVPAFLRWAKAIGQRTLERLLEEAGCSEFKTVGDLAPRQREQLAAALRMDAPELLERARDREIDRWVSDRNRGAAA